MAKDEADDGLPKIVVHCFRPGHSGQETCLDADLVLLEACASALSSGGGDSAQCISFVESLLPEVGAFGPLPAAYVNGRPVPARQVCHTLWKQFAPSAGSHETAQVRARAFHFEAVLAALLELVLWAHGPSYRGFTHPALLRGDAAKRVGVAGRALLRGYCRRCRKQAKGNLASAPAELKIHEFSRLVASLAKKMDSEGSSGRRGPLQLDDLVLYAHAKVLLQVPSQLLPWEREVWGFSQLKQFVEDVDGLLSQGTATLTLAPCSSWSLLESASDSPPNLVLAAGTHTLPFASFVSWCNEMMNWWRTGGGERPPSGSHGPEEGEGADFTPPVQWRTNALFITYLTFSMGLFALWTARRQKK